MNREQSLFLMYGVGSLVLLQIIYNQKSEGMCLCAKGGVSGSETYYPRDRYENKCQYPDNFRGVL